MMYIMYIYMWTHIWVYIYIYMYLYIQHTYVKQQSSYEKIVGMGDVYCVKTTTMMMSGGFAAFSFGCLHAFVDGLIPAWNIF